MSETEGIPYHFLRRILQRLTKICLVESKEGAGGGVKLSVDPSEIRIIDVIKIFQVEIELSECMFRRRICETRATCALKREIKGIENLVKAEFEKLTIGMFVEKSRDNGER